MRHEFLRGLSVQRLDGAAPATRTCIKFAVQADGRDEPGILTTVEALEQDGKVHPLQQDFPNTTGACNAGMRTPGMLMSSVALLVEGQIGRIADLHGVAARRVAHRDPQ